jgi:hypothetical protein
MKLPDQLFQRKKATGPSRYDRKIDAVETPVAEVSAKKPLRSYQSLADFHDGMVALTLKAPDNFKDLTTWTLVHDQQGALRDEFERLRSGFHFAERRLKNEHLSLIARELIDMAQAAYLAGDKKTGAHTLQECEGLIWPSRALRPKYAVEAERRVFGEITLYKGAVISPYPYEGSASDLGPDQATLLALAERWCRRYQSERKDFLYFSWVMANDGAISRTSVLPKEDEHTVLQPVQKSFGYKRLKELGDSGSIRACVLVQRSLGADQGLVSYDLEQAGRPRVSARQLYKLEAGQMLYETMRYHLEDPQLFPEQIGPDYRIV